MQSWTFPSVCTLKIVKPLLRLPKISSITEDISTPTCCCAEHSYGHPPWLQWTLWSPNTPSCATTSTGLWTAVVATSAWRWTVIVCIWVPTLRAALQFIWCRCPSRLLLLWSHPLLARSRWTRSGLLPSCHRSFLKACPAMCSGILNFKPWWRSLELVLLLSIHPKRELGKSEKKTVTSVQTSTPSVQHFISKVFFYPST
jgi:hypothetical protein